MPGCKLTKSLDNKMCQYAVAGARALYLANYYGPVVGAAPVENAIAYQVDTDGYIDSIILPAGEVFYKVEGANNTISFTDALLAGGNGGKYRQHTVNAVLNQYDIDVLNEGDALSLGKFIAIVIDNAGRPILLGRTGGLSAPAGGFDYNSGAAEADATGWTILLQGSSMEIGPILLNEAVVTPIDSDTIIPTLGNAVLTDVPASDKVTWVAVTNATNYDVYVDGAYMANVLAAGPLEYSYAALDPGTYNISVVPQAPTYDDGSSNVIAITI